MPQVPQHKIASVSDHCINVMQSFDECIFRVDQTGHLGMKFSPGTNLSFMFVVKIVATLLIRASILQYQVLRILPLTCVALYSKVVFMIYNIT